MSKMKRIFEIIQRGESDKLKKAIDLSMENNRSSVYFLGKEYSIQDAQKILLYMYNEQAKYREIHRDEFPIEQTENGHDWRMCGIL